MTATSVASSSQMFSTFGQPTQSPSPAFNPFANHSNAGGGAFGTDASDSARAKRNKRQSPLANQSDNEGKRQVKNPFLKQDANLSDGGKQKGKNGDDRKKKATDAKKKRTNGADFPKKTPPLNARGNGKPFAETRNQGSRPTSSSSADLDDDPVPASYHSADPHARKVYEQLRKDGINPPQWPSQPGDPENKAEVTKFREKYEAYRDKVRASLTKAGLIDDPEKRKTLQDAINFKGISEDMCPEYEKITRINEMDVHLPEKSRKTTFPDTKRMVKKLARSAAGQEAPLPMDVRSIGALRRTLDYLIDDLLRNDANLPTLHSFLWDRTRAIRRDFTFFSSLTPDEMKIQVYVLENIARFHVTALHLLSREGKAPQDFVEQQELEQLGKALLSLRDLYDDCNEQGVVCENEAEFRAYYLVFHAFDPNIIETLQRQWKANLWRDSDEVRTAVSLVEALQSTQHFHGPLKDAPSLAASAAYYSYFRIVEDPKVSYTMACFAECHFPHLRRSILTSIKKALGRPRESSKDVTTAVLNKFLRFDTIEEAVGFAELHDFEFGQFEAKAPDGSRQYLILDNRKPLPHHRLPHQFSRKLVERKRGSRALPDLIHQSICEDPNAPKSMTNGSAEESLFLSDTETPTTQPSIPTGTNTTRNAFASSGPPAGGLGGNGALNNNSAFTTQSSGYSLSDGDLRCHSLRDDFRGTKMARDEPLEIWQRTTSHGNISHPGSAFQQTPSQPNPFAPGATSEVKKPTVSPFASTPGQTPPSAFDGTTNTAFNSAPGQLGTLNGAAPSFASFIKPPVANNIPAPKNPFAPTDASNSTGTQPAKPANPLSFSTQPQTSPWTGTPLGQQNGAKVPSSTATEPVKAPGINLIPPTPTTLSHFTPATTSPSPFTPSTLSGTALPPSAGPQPSLRTMLGKTSTPPTQSEIPAMSTTFLTPGTTSTKPTFSLADTSSLQPSSSPSVLGLPSTTATTAPISLPKPTSPPHPPAPPRDMMGDITKWYVKGDDGLIEDFQAFMLDNILQSVFRKFEKEQNKRRQQEEAERALSEANQFRMYSLSVKYFYRWRDNARELRLSQLRRSGRDQMRTYYEAQRAAHLKAQKEAARRAAKERAELAEVNRPEEFMDMLKHKKPSKRQAQDALLSSGVLSGVNNEQAAAAKIVHKVPSVNGSVSSSQSRLSRSSTVKGGSKTQALREQLLGDGPASFRRSLPPMPSRDAGGSDSGTRVSKVSERWRLKAMGIVQMPDGTAIPESLANDTRYGKKRYSGIGSMGPSTSGVVRRASIADLTRPGGQGVLSGSHEHSDAKATETLAAKNKRKRDTDDDEELARKAASEVKAHKRVMSDAQNLMSELRAMREEMEEGASWFRDQNERLQSESASRGSTPWDQNF
ncbi:actin cytoskeleton and mitosis protein [Neonectria magnoliae]|uniref:Actin cytoskeleton and mitosis protein n=1 Tax=Neonectria magnoliae TaxID=2732573 RepID=A0ABR1IGG4_9HYPO